MTKNKKLHVVCFDIPYPADYGGAIEEWYKLKAIAQCGVKIHLHCFEYNNRKPSDTLEAVCEKVYYYKRDRKWSDAFSSIPFIVKSRMHDDLLKNLCADDFPILFDGTHSTGFLNHPNLAHRHKTVRLHNIEWIYYRILLDEAVSLKEKVFYFTEYKKLIRYDAQLVHAQHLSCLSQSDFDYYSEKFPEQSIALDYVFHENTDVESKTGKGDYVLYHGNLALADNYAYVIELIEKQLYACPIPVVIAGRQPNEALKKLIRQYAHIRLVENPSQAELKQLVQEAQACLSFAKNPSGVKLKLINSLFNARFVLANEAALNGSNLDDLVETCSVETLNATLTSVMSLEFTNEIIEKRKKTLISLYNNHTNAQNLLNHIYHE